MLLTTLVLVWAVSLAEAVAPQPPQAVSGCDESTWYGRMGLVGRAPTVPCGCLSDKATVSLRTRHLSGGGGNA